MLTLVGFQSSDPRIDALEARVATLEYVVYRTPTPNLNPIFVTATALASRQPLPSPTRTTVPFATMTPSPQPSRPTWTATIMASPTPEAAATTTRWAVAFSGGMNIRPCASLKCAAVGGIGLGYEIDVDMTTTAEGYLWGHTFIDGASVWVALQSLSGYPYLVEKN